MHYALIFLGMFELQKKLLHNFQLPFNTSRTQLLQFKNTIEIARLQLKISMQGWKHFNTQFFPKTQCSLSTHLQCPLGPVTAADDDCVRTSHGADAFQSGSTTNGDSGHSKVLDRWKSVNHLKQPKIAYFIIRTWRFQYGKHACLQNALKYFRWEPNKKRMLV